MELFESNALPSDYGIQINTSTDFSFPRSAWECVHVLLDAK